MKISMKNPLVEMDGDEMTRILWSVIKEELIEPFVELKTEYYDLGLSNRDKTADRVTSDAAEATRRLGVAVKCATITPNTQRMKEYKLKEMWKSPNATIRSMLDGTVFRTPILAKPIKPFIRTWEKPITIARHAYGDIYKSEEIRTEEPGKCELVFTGESGKEIRKTVALLNEPGIFQGIHNRDSSIRLFARSVFDYALSLKQDVWFAAKDTISEIYDGAFREIMEEEYNKSYAAAFSELGISYFYTLIDDAVARVVRSGGGFIWACKNYDGDVMSDMLSTAFGSLAMMKSVLVSPDGCYEYEAAHGTVTQHYYRYMKGESTSTNPVATIFAWTGALKKRGELDNTEELCEFAERLEKACIETIEAGIMTKDLLPLAEEYFGEIGMEPVGADTASYLRAVRERLEK